MRPRNHRLKLSTVAAGVLSCAVSFSLATPLATADEPVVSNQQVDVAVTDEYEAELSQFWNDYGVSESQQTDLLEKLEQGDVWDSFKESSHPVSSESHEDNESITTIDRFQDGSISVSTISAPTAPNGGISAQSVRDCRVVSDVNATQQQQGCHAQVNLGIISMGFYFDKITSPGQLGRVTNFYGEHNHVIGGAFSNHRLQKFNNQTVRYSADLDVAFRGFPLGWTAWMQVNLGQGNYAYTTHN
ncbi:hypothetical protein [Corynebacterium glutamicum]|uniref:hypothetical protein n=1 Tax=Corynebacterium glutamicum TaxID=1718 RepID=UPI0007448F96|nr:hypothetical protein [Corynebacterium glutamicum]AMA00109.1 hypothetical protein APT58_07670 [Corynebacterium glutamicum]